MSLADRSRKDFLAAHPDYPKGKSKHGDFYAANGVNLPTGTTDILSVAAVPVA